MKNPMKKTWVMLAAALIMAAGTGCASHFQMGMNALEKKDYDKAIAEFTEEIRSNPKDATTYNNRGYAYIMKGDLNLAIGDFEKSLKIRPGNKDAMKNLDNARKRLENQNTGTTTAARTAAADDELDIAIRDASDYLNDNIPRGSKIVILNIESVSANLSEYIIDELIANAVNDKNFSVVDRRQLDAIQSEQKFQMSGAVDDKDALAIGKFFGAQTIISGAMRDIGSRYRMTIRALSVQTAQVQGQYNRNMAVSEMLAGLANSTGSRPVTSAVATTNNRTTQVAFTAASATVSSTSGIAVNNVSTWNAAVNTIRNGGNDRTYVINIVGNVSVPDSPNNEPLFGPVTGITVTIQGNGTLSLSVSGNLLRIGAGQTVIVRNVKLRGRSDNNSSLVVIMGGGIFRMEGSASVTGNTGGRGVYVNGGNFIMRDKASVSGNTLSGNSSRGGGVFVDGGTFIMQGSATVSGNTANWCSGWNCTVNGGGVSILNGTFIMQENAAVSGNTGGGVFVSSGGTFSMEGGTISGNNASGNQSSNGGGVYIDGGKFTMLTGIVSHNTANGSGGGVYVNSGTFNMQDGTVLGNTAKDGSGGGVFVSSKATFSKTGGTFTKTGGTINGSDVALGVRNTASKQGHAVYLDSSPARWRNATAGPNDGTGGYGFLLND